MRVTRARTIDHGLSGPEGTSRPRRLQQAVALCAAALAVIGLTGTAGANTSNGINLPTGVTDLAEAMYALHMEVFWICVGIAVAVFGTMIYSLVKFRRSIGAIPDTTMVHSTKVEIIWTVIPV